MRSKFDIQLEELNSRLIEMGALCENAIAASVKSLLSGDMELAARAIASDREVDRKEREIESLCLRLLLLQQPVARDLRLISAALKMITDMERIGDQASDIAEIVTVAGLSGDIIPTHIPEMAREAVRMVTESIDAFVNRDLVLARSVIASDDIVDALFVRVKDELVAMIAGSPEDSGYAMDILMIAKYFERIGDHATNIAEWVEFAITGDHAKDGVNG